MAIFFSPAGTCSLRSFPRFPQPSRLLWPELFCLKITLQKHHSSLWPPQRTSPEEQIKLPGHFKRQGKHFLCTQFSAVTWGVVHRQHHWEFQLTHLAPAGVSGSSHWWCRYLQAASPTDAKDPKLEPRSPNSSALLWGRKRCSHLDATTPVSI